MSNDNVTTRRTALKAVGASFAAGVGVATTASADCTPCDDSSYDHRFCGNECVATSSTTEVYDKCPFDALSYVWTIESGRTGFIEEICKDGCSQGLKVTFDCTETWWVKATDVEQVDRTNCFC